MKRTVKSVLSAKDIKHFRQKLIEKRSEILSDVMHMENESLRRSDTELSHLPVHMADAGTDNFDTDNTLGLMDSERKILTEIYDALGRIEKKTYGTCEGDGRPIPKVRLEAIPWARFCVACAAKAEKGQFGKETLPHISSDEQLRLSNAADLQDEDFDSFDQS